MVNGTDVAGEFATFGYSWTNGTYNSPSFSQQTELQLVNPSAYTAASGNAGFGLFPYDGVDLTMSLSQTSSDTFTFNPNNNSFKYLSTNNFYSTDPTQIDTLLGLATTVPQPYLNTSGNNYQVTIPGINLPAANQFLYLIYDLRNVVNNQICFSDISADDACCGCSLTCSTAYFSPVQGNLLDVCNSNTNATGSAQNSFNGIGNIPTIGEPCFKGTTCDTSQPVDAGYYIVDIAQPALSNPKNWIQVDDYGIVIDEGIC